MAEYLLGDLSLKLLPAMILMAPMYGGGALLIREHVRHKGRGWPTILCLGAAYALLEEGLVGQSLFNPDYLKLHVHFLGRAHGVVGHRRMVDVADAQRSYLLEHRRFDCAGGRVVAGARS